MNFHTSFGDLVRRRRKYRGLSLRELAARVDFDQSSLSKVERSEMMPPSWIIKPLSQALDADFPSFQMAYLSEKIYGLVADESFSVEALESVRERLLQERSMKKAEDRERVLGKLRAYFETIPVKKVWLFGSFSREEEDERSDVDLLIRFEKPNLIDLFDYVGFKQDLEEITGRKVDLVEEGYLIPEAEHHVAREKKLIYARKAK